MGQLRPLTAVCRAWRGAAIDTPSLWSTALVCQTPDKESPWYKACLERSGQGPLDVFADLATRRGVTKFLMQNGARVHDLCLVYPDNQDSVRYGPMQLALTLPNLECCTISGGLIVRSSLCRFPPYAMRRVRLCGRMRARTRTRSSSVCGLRASLGRAWELSGAAQFDYHAMRVRASDVVTLECMDTRVGRGHGFVFVAGLLYGTTAAQRRFRRRRAGARQALTTRLRQRREGDRVDARRRRCARAARGRHLYRVRRSGSRLARASRARRGICRLPGQ